jgi:hypothetical protein
MSNSEMVLVPRTLLGAVANALETGNPASKTLESVREFYLADGSEEQPGAAEVTLRAIASQIGLDLSGPLPEGELSTVIINAIRGGADDFPDTKTLQEAGKYASGADWAEEEKPLSNLQKLESDIPPHQLRVLEELAQLTDRLDKLTAFFDTDIYRSLDVDERGRLKEQCALMGELQRVLSERVAAF